MVNHNCEIKLLVPYQGQWHLCDKPTCFYLPMVSYSCEMKLASRLPKVNDSCDYPFGIFKLF